MLYRVHLAMRGIQTQLPHDHDDGHRKKQGSSLSRNIVECKCINFD